MVFRNLTTFFWVSCLFLSGEILVAENLLTSYRWDYISDRVMGGLSDGKAQYEVTTSGRALRLIGEVSTANNGGFIQVRTQDLKTTPENALGLQVTVKGNLESYFIHIRTSGTRLPWHYYAHSFKTTSEWTVVKLPFNKFKRSSRFINKNLNKSKISSIGIVAYGKDHHADLYIQDFRFYD